MATFIALVFSLFVFAMTSRGIVYAVGPVGAPKYDLEVSARLLETIYVKAFGVPEIAATSVSFILLAIPAILAFFTVQAILGSKQ